MVVEQKETRYEEDAKRAVPTTAVENKQAQQRRALMSAIIKRASNTLTNILLVTRASLHYTKRTIELYPISYPRLSMIQSLRNNNEMRRK